MAAKSPEGKTMCVLVENFIARWAPGSEEAEEELIELIGECQKYMTIHSMKNEVLGVNLHSEYNTVISEISAIKDSLQGAFEKTSAELKQQFESNKTTRSKKKTDYGVFSSKIAMEFADSNGIDGDNVVGTGKDGKVTKKDIEKTMSTKKKKNPSSKKSKKSKEKCNETTDSGDPCKNSGSVLIAGKWYCKKHKDRAVSNLETMEEEEISDYDEDTDNAIAKFRNDSIKSMEMVESDDERLNELVGSDIDE